MPNLISSQLRITCNPGPVVDAITGATCSAKTIEVGYAILRSLVGSNLFLCKRWHNQSAASSEQKNERNLVNTSSCELCYHWFISLVYLFITTQYTHCMCTH